MPVNLLHHNVRAGQTVVAIPPQRRVMLFPRRCRVWLPHIVFVCRYTRVPGGVKWDGYYINSSKLYFTKEPPNLDTRLMLAPTDPSGHVCLRHAWDGEIFANPKVMIGTLLRLWYTHLHSVSDIGLTRWASMSLSEVLENGPGTPWWDAGRLSDLLPAGAKLIDKPMGLLPSLTEPGRR